MHLRTVILIRFLVNNLSHTPLVFSELRIPKDFKCRVFGTAHSKGVMGAICGTAHSKRVRRKWAVTPTGSRQEDKAVVGEGSKGVTKGAGRLCKVEGGGPPKQRRKRARTMQD